MEGTTLSGDEGNLVSVREIYPLPSMMDLRAHRFINPFCRR